MKVTKPLLELTAEDLMSRDVVTIPQTASLRQAAHTLRQANVSGAPVVDEWGRCVGVLSASDFLRWAEANDPNRRDLPLTVCRYLTRGHPASGWDGWLCVLAPGNCPHQSTQPTVEGRHVSVCLRPGIIAEEWQRLTQRLPGDSVRHYLTADVVTANPQTRLTDLARMMIDADVHRIFITDDAGRPVGVVSATDLVAALAAEGLRLRGNAPPETASRPEVTHAGA